MKLALSIGLAVTALALVAGCGKAPLPAVKNSLGGPGRTNFYPWEARNLYTRKVLHLDSTRLPSGCGLPVCVGAQALIVPMNNGSVASVAADTLAWVAGCALTGDSSAISGVAVDSVGNIYGSARSSIFSLTSAGAPRWKIPLQGHVNALSLLSPPLLMNGLVYVCSDDSVIWCTDTEGHVRWVKHCGSSLLPQIAGTPGGDIVCVMTHGMFRASDSIAVISPEGTVRASWELPGVRVVQGPVVDGDQITVAGVTDSADARHGIVCRFDLRGSKTWMKMVEILPTGLAVDDEGGAYVCGPVLRVEEPRAQVVQFDRTGSQRWYVTLEGIFATSPAVTRRYVYAVIAYPGGRALYQFTRDGKIEEQELIAGEPGAPFIDAIGRVVIADAQRAQLSILESDAVGKLR